MSPTKQQAIRAIKGLPDEATIDDMIERLHFIAQVEAGIRAADEGRTISHDEVKKRVIQWLRK